MNKKFNSVLESISFIKENGKLWLDVLKHTGSVQKTKEMIEDRYAGRYENQADFLKEFMRDVENIPEYLNGYINYEQMAQDYFASSFLSIDGENGAVHVFYR